MQRASLHSSLPVAERRQLPNPYQVERPAGPGSFVGRDEVFVWAEEALRNYQPDAPLILLAGRHRGKSSILRQLEAGRLGEDYVCLYIPVVHLTVHNVTPFLWSIVSKAGDSLQRQGRTAPFISYGDFAGDPIRSFLQQFIAPLAASGTGENDGPRRIVLMLDDADPLLAKESKRTPATALRQLLYDLGKREPALRYLFTVTLRAELPPPEQLAPFSEARLYQPGPLSDEAALALIRRPVPYRVPRAVADHIRTLAGDDPRTIQHLCRALFRRWQESGLGQITSADVVAAIREDRELASLLAEDQTPQPPLPAASVPPAVAPPQPAPALIAGDEPVPTEADAAPIAIDAPVAAGAEAAAEPAASARPRWRRWLPATILLLLAAAFILLLPYCSAFPWSSLPNNARLPFGGGLPLGASASSTPARTPSEPANTTRVGSSKAAGSVTGDAAANLASTPDATTKRRATGAAAVVSSTLRPSPTGTRRASATAASASSATSVARATGETAATVTAEATPALTARFVRSADDMPMRLIPTGIFPMGSLPEEPGVTLDELPQHQVAVSRFYIDLYEVSVAQYAAFLNELGDFRAACDGRNCALPRSLVGRFSYLEEEVNEDGTRRYQAMEGYEDHPINNVTWYGADSYCGAMGARLPTEAEWEYAARGSEGRIYPWGDEPPESGQALFNTQGFDDLQPVNALPQGATPLGVQGLAGSMWEWVADWYDPAYYQDSPADNPQGPESGLNRVTRGGAWPNNVLADRIRGAYRNPLPPYFISPAVGFRCALTPERDLPAEP